MYHVNLDRSRDWRLLPWPVSSSSTCRVIASGSLPGRQGMQDRPRLSDDAKLDTGQPAAHTVCRPMQWLKTQIATRSTQRLRGQAAHAARRATTRRVAELAGHSRRRSLSAPAGICCW